MSTYDIFTTVFPVFAIILVGVAFAGVRRIDLDGVTDIVLYVTSPCLIFSGLMKWHVDVREVLIIPAGATVIVLGCGAITWIYHRVTGKGGRGHYLPTMFMNAGNMFLPLALFAWGEEGLSRAILFLVSVSVLLSSVGISIVSRDHGPWEALKLPWLYVTLLAIALNMTGTALPAFLLRPVELLGQAAIPLMLLSLGIRLRSIAFAAVGTAAALSVIRIGGGLAVATAFVKIAGIEGLSARVLILGGMMPAAVVNFVLTEKYDESPRTVATTIIMTTAASLATVPVALKFLG